MADPKFQPVRHDHKAFLDKASKRPGFNEAYEALKIELIPTNRKWRKNARTNVQRGAVQARRS